MNLPADEPRETRTGVPRQPAAPDVPPAPEPASSPAPRSLLPRRWPWIAAAVAAVLIAGGGGAYLLMPSDEDEAVERCQAAIRDKLFSPSTAVFAEDVEQNNSPPVYRIIGELDAQNKFGGTLRGEYICVLRHEDDGSWVTIDARTITR